MCGRYSLHSKAPAINSEYQIRDSVVLAPRYNIAPTQDAPVVRAVDGKRRSLSILRWGLIPSWAKDEKIGHRMINARAETVAEKPSFRSALQKRRCIIPADGFYEWKQTEQGKQPYFIQPHKRSLLGLAGLWEEWKSKEGQAIQSFTIITTEANGFMQPIHDRMPVILDRNYYEQWLNCRDYDGKQVSHLLKPCPGDLLDMYPVGKQVNSPSNDSRACIQKRVDGGT